MARWTNVELPTSVLATTLIEGASPDTTRFGSEKPRVGSFSAFQTMSERTTPGAPMAAKAHCQPKLAASQPPATAPITPPIGRPKTTIEYAEARWLGGK